MSALGIIVFSPAGPRDAYRTPALAIAAARAGAIGVIDLEFVKDGQQLRDSVEQLKTHSKGGTAGLRCRSGFLPELKLLGLSGSGGMEAGGTPALPGQTVLVLTPGIGVFDEAVLKKDINSARAAGLNVFVETVSIKEALLAQECGADAVIAKGHEASGRVGDTTAFVLVQQCARQLKIPVWAQGGIGFHTAAAVKAAGAAGVVLDSQLYLCRDSLIPRDVQLRLERFDGSETTLLKSVNTAGFRLFAPGGNKMQELEQSSPAGRCHPLQEVLDRNIERSDKDGEIWIVGQDACFAKRFALTGGSVAGCIDALRQAADEHLDNVAGANVLREGSDLALSHGTRYPVVQGAMTRVSDTSDFALAVAQGGGLPFLALSMMRGAEIEKLLLETRTKLGDLPWGVGVLGFVPQQLRQEQMEVVDRFKPPFALIAGGRPDQAKALDDGGTKTYLHVPSPLLLKSFIEMGSRRFIFEGKECGGHVGPRSSFVLWETMIEVLLESIGPKGNPADFHILFAGGIHDDLSAAMVAAMAAPLVVRGVKIGVLVGTAYLFTKEAVEGGAIVDAFQKAALDCEDTVLLETGPGHSIRCIDSPYKQTFDRCRVELEMQNKSRDEVREELELMNLGRLRIASKGITRGDSGLESLPIDKQWQEGMYMIGQVAAIRNEVVSIADLHRNICNDGQERLAELQARSPSVDVAQEPHAEGIAIVGMSCMLPQANDVETFWQNILNKVDAITEIPDTHFKWQNYYDPNPLARDKCISKWGGFLGDVVFDPAPYGIPPSSLAAIDPMQVLILEAARSALFDAGYSDRKFPRDKTSMILANAGHGPITAMYSLRSMLEWKLEGLCDKDAEEVRAKLPEWSEDSFPGYLGNVTAGRVANRLDLRGLNFAIDAACASSLAALYVAVSDLRAGTSDVVLLGGSDTHNQPGDYLSFSKTHALSPRGRCHTFDANADGIAISEGLAMLVLKRLSDAERDGDRIYAVIRGIGGSSDGRDLSLTAPRPAGQMLALERAYADAGVSPSTIGLVEAHGTGTVAGDKAEVEALTKVFERAGAPSNGCAIGSVKTNIGHTKATAGLASLVKVAKALHHKILPPSINVSTPNPACKFGEGPFYLSTEAKPWLNGDDTAPRRAGVSAFGFGGTNFHAVLEEYTPPCPVEEAPTLEAWPCELFVWKAVSQEDLLKALKQTETSIEKVLGSGVVETASTSLESRRLFELASKLHLKLNDLAQPGTALSIVASSFADLKTKISRVKDMLKVPQAKSFSLPMGVHYAADALAPPKVAYLFPGQGSQRVDMLKGLSLFFPSIRKSIESSDRALRSKLGSPLSKLIYPVPALSEDERAAQHENLTATKFAQPALGACDLAMLRLLGSFGAKPDMVAGHSYGEYVALHAAGVLTDEQFLQLSADRGRILGDCAKSNPGAMAAVSSDQQSVSDVINPIEGVYLANVNAPSQCIISGAEQSIEAALAEFKKRNIAAKRISVSAAFHSPLLSASSAPLAEALRQYKFAPPQISVYSNTTAKPYAAETESIVSQLAEHALQPVLFARQLEAMYEDGARIFVEVGPGSVLTGLTETTLKGKDIFAVSTERAKNALEHFLSAIGLLTVYGAVKDIGNLFWNRMPGLQGATYELAVSRKRGQLLYRVNSVKIEPVHKIESKKLISVSKGNDMADNVANNSSNNGRKELTREIQSLQANSAPIASIGNNGGPNSLSRSADASRALPKDAMTPPAAPYVGSAMAGTKPDGSVERVMMEFQRSMLEMTNRFLETQENVMMAYLRGGGVAPAQQRDAAAPAQEYFQQQPAMRMYQPHPPQAADSAPAQIDSDRPPTDEHNDRQHDAGPLSAAMEQEGSERASGALDTEVLIDSLFEIVSDRTGYPRSMLDTNLDLEADLGIDSIKRVEILNNFRKLLPEATQEKLESGIEKLAGTKTLQGIIDWIRSLNDETAGSDSPPAAVSTVETGNYKNVGRGLVTVKVLEAPKATSTPLAPLSLLISNSKELAKSVEKELIRGKQEVVVLAAQAHGDIAQAISEVRRKHGQIGSVLYLCDPRQGESMSASRLFEVVKEVELDLRENAAQGRRSALICTTGLGGTFGAGSLNAELPMEVLVQQAGVVGLSKTVAKEFSGVHVKAIDLESGTTAEQLAEVVWTELTADDRIVEIGVSGGRRIGLDIVEAEYQNADETPPPLPALDRSSVVLVTGGARGITAEITLDLARRYRPNFVIVGRIPRPAETESSVTAGLESARDIKTAIIEEMRAAGKIINVRDVERAYQHLLREREVRNTLAKLKAAGSTVRYYSADVSDENAFARLIDSIYETSSIDGVIHGAGIIEDALIKDKALESFDRVFHTKVNSALTLARRVRLDNLKFMFLFSSIVGRTGNSGQCDYVAANEAINKLAIRIKKDCPGRVASLLWGPWQAGMAPPELEEVFASHGWSMIQPADGRACFHEEFNCNRFEDVEVMLVGKTKNPKRSEDERAQSTELLKKLESPAISSQPLQIAPSGVFLHKARLQSQLPPTFSYTIDTKEHRYLHDHKFDGIPVMPMAVALEMMLEAARSIYADRRIVRVSNLDIPAGVVFHAEQKEFHVEARVDRNRDGLIDLQFVSLSPTKKTHFRCQAQLANAPQTIPDRWVTASATEISRKIGACSSLPSEAVIPQAKDVYGKWLFHGPIFQGIKKVLFLSKDGISGEVVGSQPLQCISSADSSDWNIDPVLLDSSMQLAGVWARHYQDVTVLPTGFKSLHLFGSMPARATAQIFLSTAMASELLCDLAVYDEEGELAFVVEGLGGIASKAFNRFSSPALKELVQ